MMDMDTTVADIARKARIAVMVCHVLAEHIRPADVGTSLHIFAARMIAAVLMVESLFRHGFYRPDLAEYHARLCRDRDEALRRLKIQNPYLQRRLIG
jgi:hypothetical protein